MDMEKAIQKLVESLGSENIIKINDFKYKVKTNLFLLNNFDEIPVFLVNIDGKIYFADYGYTFESIKEEYLDNQNKNNMKMFNEFLYKNNIEFEDQRFVMQTNSENILIDFNIFVRTIFLLEDIFD